MLNEFESQVKSAGTVEGPPPKKAKLETGFNASKLMTMVLPEPKWAVPNILPEGLNILAGKPKMGKSILSLNIALAIASGGKALGGKIDVERGAVLYLALEDTKRRLQSRIRAMLQDRPAPENLFFETVWPKIDAGGIPKLAKKIQEISNLRLLIIDTLKKIRPIQNSRKNPYDTDYENVSAVKMLADKFNLSVLVIHHLRKTESDDIMDDFSGTFGLTGAADGLLALKRKTGQSDAELFLIGRDVDAAEYALKYHPDIWTWELLGDAQEVKATRNLQATYDAIKKSEEALAPKEIAEISGVKYRTVTANLKSLVNDGSIKKKDRGKYGI